MSNADSDAPAPKRTTSAPRPARRPAPSRCGCFTLDGWRPALRPCCTRTSGSGRAPGHARGRRSQGEEDEVAAYEDARGGDAQEEGARD
jgi:hypothetical protein